MGERVSELARESVSVVVAFGCRSSSSRGSRSSSNNSTMIVGVVCEKR